MNASTKSMPIVVLILGMVIPTLITWIYFDWLASSVDAEIFVIGYLLVFA